MGTPFPFPVPPPVPQHGDVAATTSVSLDYALARATAGRRGSLTAQQVTARMYLY